jgi:hypothetical protein
VGVGEVLPAGSEGRQEGLSRPRYTPILHPLNGLAVHPGSLFTEPPCLRPTSAGGVRRGGRWAVRRRRRSARAATAGGGWRGQCELTHQSGPNRPIRGPGRIAPLRGQGPTGGLAAPASPVSRWTRWGARHVQVATATRAKSGDANPVAGRGSGGIGSSDRRLTGEARQRPGPPIRPDPGAGSGWTRGSPAKRTPPSGRCPGDGRN